VERWRWRHGSEHGDGLTEFIVQPTKSVDDERRVGDGGVAVVEGVGKALETAAIFASRHVALEQAVKLLLVIDMR